MRTRPTFKGIRRRDADFLLRRSTGARPPLTEFSGEPVHGNAIVRRRWSFERRWAELRTRGCAGCWRCQTWPKASGKTSFVIRRMPHPSAHRDWSSPAAQSEAHAEPGANEDCPGRLAQMGAETLADCNATLQSALVCPITRPRRHEQGRSVPAGRRAVARPQVTGVVPNRISSARHAPIICPVSSRRGGVALAAVLVGRGPDTVRT